MPGIFTAIGRGIAGGARAIRGGAQQVTPPPAATADDTTQSVADRSPLARFGSLVKRQAANAPVERGIRALRQRAAKRKTTARTTR